MTLPAAAPSVDPEEAFAVWHDNWPAVQLFLRCATQWRMAPMGGASGLDYTAVEAVMRMRRLRDRDALLDALQVMEVAVLRELAQRSAKD